MEDDFALVERRGLLLTSAAALTLTALPWESRAEGESEPLSTYITVSDGSSTH
jgi:hypothetical protein